MDMISTIRTLIRIGPSEKTRTEEESASGALRLTGTFLTVYVNWIAADLTRRTPKSLKYMRESCPRCMELPDDCAYYDYSIFDVKKAARRIMAQPEYIRERVLNRLDSMNPELGRHLHERLE